MRIKAIRQDSLHYGSRERLVGKRCDVLFMHPAILSDGFRYALIRVLEGPLRGTELYIVGVKFDNTGDKS